MHKLLKKIEITYDMFLYDWFLTLFIKPLHLETVARVWDNLFISGTPFLFRTAIGILDYISDSFIENFESTMFVLSKLPKTISSKELFASIQGVKVRAEELKALELIN